jgi:hypothetical protein
LPKKLEPCGWMLFSGLPDGPFRWGIVQRQNRVGFYFRNPRESFPLISREQFRTVISREQFRTVPWVNFVTPHLLLKFVIDN